MGLDMEDNWAKSIDRELGSEWILHAQKYFPNFWQQKPPGQLPSVLHHVTSPEWSLHDIHSVSH